LPRYCTLTAEEVMTMPAKSKKATGTKAAGKSEAAKSGKSGKSGGKSGKK
jgi:hypothetical protein